MDALSRPGRCSIQQAEHPPAEHIIVATTEIAPQCDEGFLKTLDDWCFRDGVATVTLISPNGLPDAVAGHADKRLVSIPSFPLQKNVLYPANPINRALNLSILTGPSITPALVGDGSPLQILEADIFQFVVDFYTSEAPLLDLSLRDPLRHDVIRLASINTHHGGYSARHETLNGRRYSYYKFCRFRLIEYRSAASSFLTNLSKCRPHEPSALSDLLSEALSTIVAYLDQLIVGDGVLRSVKRLNMTLHKIRSARVLEPFLTKLHDAPVFDACKVISLLSTFRARGTLPILRRLLTSPDKELRLFAARAICRQPSPKRYFELRRALADDNNRIRLTAINGLAQTRFPNSLNILARHFRTGSIDEREIIISALGSSASIVAFRFLLDELLKDKDALRHQLDRSLGELAHDRTVSRRMKSWYLRLPKERQTKLLQDLIRTSKAIDDGYGAHACIHTLAIFGDMRVAPYLAGILRNKNHTARFEAAEALGDIGGRTAQKAISIAIREPDRDLPWSAVEAAGKLRIKNTLPDLVNLLAKRKWESQAVEALGLLGEPSAVPHLEAAAAKSHYLARTVVVALRHLGATDAAARISTQLPPDAPTSDRDSYIRFCYPRPWSG